MFCNLKSYCLYGIDALSVDVEVDLSDGLPCFDIVGLPDSAVKESKDRVKSALKNSGFDFPVKRITINLAPGDVKKEGSLYDLPIALGILCCMGYLQQSHLNHRFFAGELSLDGHLRKIRGIVPMLCQASLDTIKESIIPTHNACDSIILSHVPIIYCNHLLDVIAYLTKKITPPKPSFPQHTTFSISEDFLDVKGQETAKKGLMVGAAGRHNMLLVGPPGSGKTMLAKRLPSILPPLCDEEALELTKIYSITEKSSLQPHSRPFRSPHHTITLKGLVGGGAPPQPGEITLAHHGVLFLDELLEFNRTALETLRQPLEDKSVTLSRSHHTFTYPANFILMASTNPCPCGYYPDFKKCTCDLHSIKRYLSKLSGPLLDRIDIHLETLPLSLDDFNSETTLSTKEMLTKILDSVAIQQKRFMDFPFNYNSEIPASLIKKFCTLSSEAETLLHSWFNQNNATARSYQRVLRLSRTIADLNHLETIDLSTLSQAINYRMLDRKFWNN